MTITEFLESRIAEDEADIRLHFCEPGFEVRGLTECAAKLALVAEHGISEVASLDKATWGQPFKVCRTCAQGTRQIVAPCPTIKVLAAVYKDHPDYQKKWAP